MHTQNKSMSLDSLEEYYGYSVTKTERNPFNPEH